MQNAIDIHFTYSQLMVNPSERCTHEPIVNNFKRLPWSCMNRPVNHGSSLFRNKESPDKIPLLTELNFLNPSIDQIVQIVFRKFSKKLLTVGI